MSRGAKLATIMLAIVGVLVALVFGLLSNREVTTRVGQDVLKRLDQQIPAKVSFSHLSVNPARGTIAVDDLEATVPGKPGEKFITTKQVILDVDMASLLVGRVHLQRIHLVNPEATIIHRGNNHYNFEEVLPKKKAEPKQGTSFVALDRVTFEGGRITYLDKPRAVTAELPHLDGNFALVLKRNDVDGQLTLSDGWAQYKAIKQPIESFLADLHFDGENLHIDKLKLDAGKTGVAVQGDVFKLAYPPDPNANPAVVRPKQPARDPELRLTAQIKTSLQQFAAIAKLPMEGFAEADLELRGTAKAPGVAGTVKASKVAVKGYHVPSLDAQFAANKEGANVKRLRAQVFGGRLEAFGHVPFVKTGPLDVTADATDLDFATAKRELKLEFEGPVSGRASAHVHATGTIASARTIDATGWVRADGTLPVEGRSLQASVASDVAWKDAVLTLTRLDARALGGRLTGRARLAPLAPVPTYSADAQLRNFEVAAIQPFVPQPLPATARVSGEISIVGRGFKQPQLTGSAHVAAVGTLKRGVAGNKKALPLSADTRLAFAGTTVQVRALTAHALGGTLTATGAVGLGGKKPDIAIAANLSGLRLAALNDAFQFAKGPIGGTLDAQATYRGNILTIDRATARTLGGVISATGRVRALDKPATYALRVTAQGVDLAAANKAFRLAQIPISGRAGATIAVSGAGPAFRATGPVRLQGLAAVPDAVTGVQNRLPFTVAGQIDAGPSAVQLLPLTATVGQSTITARGAVRLHGPSNLTFNGRIVDAPAIASLFGTRDLTGAPMTFSGSASGPAGALALRLNADIGKTALGEKLRFDAATLQATGRLDQRLAISGALRADNLDAGGQKFQRIQTPFSYSAPKTALGKGTLALSQVQATVDGARLSGNARVSLADRRFVVKLQSEGLQLRHLGALAAQTGAGVPLDTGVRLDISGQGTFDAPALHAKLALSPFTYQARQFGATEATADLAGDRLTLKGGVFGRQIDLDGVVGLKAGQDSKVTLRFNNTQLGALFSLVPSKAAESVELPVAGALTGTVVLSGPITRPARLTAAVDLSALSIAYEDLSLHNQGAIRLRYGQNRLALNQLHLVGDGTDLTARGIVGLGVPSSLNASGHVNLALLEKVSPRNLADSSGTAQLEAQLRGTLGRPDVVGALTIRDGQFSTRNLPQTVRDLNGTVRLVRDRVFLDSLSATLGYTGKVQAFGGLTLGKNMAPTYVTLEVSAKEIEARIPDVDVMLNADLAFSGTPDATRLDGQVRVLQGRVTRDVDLTGGLLAGPKGGRGAPSKTAAIPFLKNLALRTQVLIPDQFFIDNNLAKGELRGDLLVLGTATRPVVVGRAETVTGEFYFQDHTYTLEEASVDFIDPHKLTPYMHVVATTQIQGYDVRVNVNGPPEQFKLDLSSTPYLTDQDILTLIATGQTQSQLAGGTGESGLATAGNFLLNRVTKGVEQGVTDQGVVDVLKIQPGSTGGGTQTQGGSFTVGKRLSEKLMLTYSQDLLVAPGQTPGRLLIFDYLLTDQVALKLEQRLSGGYNVSARYRFSMR